MNKAELIDTLAGQTDQTKADITRTLDALLDTTGASAAQFSVFLFFRNRKDRKEGSATSDL